MAEINLIAAFSTVPGREADAIKELLTDTIQQIAQDDGTFETAKIVFTEPDERCGLTAELDGVKKEGVPLSLDRPAKPHENPCPGQKPHRSDPSGVPTHG